jgi:acyl-CoA thioesterase I
MRNEQRVVVRFGWFVGVVVGVMWLLVACAAPNQQANSPTSQPTNQPNQPTDQPTADPSPPTILAFGDSLTAGLGVAEEMAYPAQLEQKLQSAGYNYRVINGGISGETSTAALN